MVVIRNVLFLCMLLATTVMAGKPIGGLAGFATSREWSDASGRFNITGVMVEADETTLQLRKTDGRIVSVPVDKLSESDQKFIEAFLAAEAVMPAQTNAAPDPDNPFAGGKMDEASSPFGASSSRSAASGAGTSSPPSNSNTLDNINMVEMSDRNSENLSLDFGEAFWEAAPVSAIQLPPIRDRSVNLPMPKEFFASANMRVCGSQPTAYFSIYQEKRGSREGYARLGKYNVVSKESAALGQGSQPWKIMAVSKDASLLAVVRIEGFDKGNDVAILKVKGDQATPIYQFKAGGGSWSEVRWADFLSNDRLITIDQKHNLIVWDLRNRQITHRGAVNRGTLSAVVGGNGELVAIPGTGNVAFVDGKRLQQVGIIELENKVKPTIAFSDDGQFIATYTPFAVEVFSLKDGQRIKRIAVSNGMPDRPIAWIGKNLLLDNSLLIDVERERPWWNYKTGRGPKFIYGETIYTLFPEKERSTLVMTSLPHAAATRALNQAESADLLALKAGSSIAMSMNLSGIPGDQQSQIRDAMEKKIEQNGWQLAPSSNNRIELNLKQGKNESEEYVESRGFGPPVPFSRFNQGPTTKVNYRPWIHTVKITVGSNEVFSAANTVGAPGYLPNEKGKSTQQQVSERVKPSPDFFKNVRLPREIVKPEYRNGFGASEISQNGLR